MAEEKQLEILIPCQDAAAIRAVAEGLREGLGDQGTVRVETRQPKTSGDAASAGTRAVGGYEVISVGIGLGQVVLAATQLVLVLRQVSAQCGVPGEAIARQPQDGRSTTLETSDSIDDATKRLESLCQ